MDKFNELDTQDHVINEDTNINIGSSTTGSIGGVQAEHPVFWNSLSSYSENLHCIICMIRICIQGWICFTSLL